MSSFKTYIVEVTVRQAISAASNARALEVSKEIFGQLAEDGTLGAALIFEWDNPISKGEEQS